MKNFVFWDVALCRSCVNRRFGGTYRLHLQGRKIRERGTSVSRWLHLHASLGFNVSRSEETWGGALLTLPFNLASEYAIGKVHHVNQVGPKLNGTHQLLSYADEALYYKPEGHGFYSCWGRWTLQLTLSFQPHYGPGVDSASNRNEYQKSSWR
jgi:hypothetical protein